MNLTEKVLDILPGIVRENIVKRFGRSKDWSKVRKEFLKKFPKCAICKTNKSLAVHHVTPFKEVPELELDSNNLITLCEKFNHHFTFGHLMSWKKYNPNIVEDSKLFIEKIKNACKIDGDLKT